MDHPLPWLRYVDPGDLDTDTVDFDGMRVESAGGEHLGDVDGFIVDSDSARPYYVVIDAGGWFKTKHFLLPIGLTEFDPDSKAIVTDLSKARVNRFPGFDLGKFEKLTTDELKRMNDEICEMSSVSVTSYTIDEPYSATWDRPQYATPGWWRSHSPRPQDFDQVRHSSTSHAPDRVHDRPKRKRS